MRKLLISFLVLFVMTSSIVLSQENKLENTASFDSILQQMKPENTELAYDSLLHNSKDSTLLVAFYRQKIEYPGWVGKLFLKNENSSGFREITIDTVLNEGGQPRIESFFTENIDEDQSVEFFLLVSWPVKHATVKGTLYDTYVYDHIDSNSYLSLLQKVSDKFKGGCDCNWSDGRTNEVSIKSKDAIYERLEELELISN